MVRRTILGKNELEVLSVKQFVENILGQFGSAILLKEEHISRTDKLKKYRQYENGDEVKAELASMLDDFVEKYERNFYVNEVRFYASKSNGLSNYIELTFNTPFGAKQWLKRMKIRVSDHPKMNDRKVDEYIHLEGKSVEDIEKELDKIINKRIRRLQREEQLPTAQNESIRRNNNMKLRINEESSAKRYWVTGNSLIPLAGQPNEGYTKLQAIKRAQREAETDVRLFKISMSDAVKDYHIIDNTGHYCKELDSAI